MISLFNVFLLIIIPFYSIQNVIISKSNEKIEEIDRNIKLKMFNTFHYPQFHLIQLNNLEHCSSNLFNGPFIDSTIDYRFTVRLTVVPFYAKAYRIIRTELVETLLNHDNENSINITTLQSSMRTLTLTFLQAVTMLDPFVKVNRSNNFQPIIDSHEKCLINLRAYLSTVQQRISNRQTRAKELYTSLLEQSQLFQKAAKAYSACWISCKKLKTEMETQRDNLFVLDSEANSVTREVEQLGTLISSVEERIRHHRQNFNSMIERSTSAQKKQILFNNFFNNFESMYNNLNLTLTDDHLIHQLSNLGSIIKRMNILYIVLKQNYTIIPFGESLISYKDIQRFDLKVNELELYLKNFRITSTTIQDESDLNKIDATTNDETHTTAIIHELSFASTTTPSTTDLEENNYQVMDDCVNMTRSEDENDEQHSANLNCTRTYLPIIDNTSISTTASESDNNSMVEETISTIAPTTMVNDFTSINPYLLETSTIVQGKSHLNENEDEKSEEIVDVTTTVSTSDENDDNNYQVIERCENVTKSDDENEGQYSTYSECTLTFVSIAENESKHIEDESNLTTVYSTTSSEDLPTYETTSIIDEDKFVEEEIIPFYSSNIIDDLTTVVSKIEDDSTTPQYIDRKYLFNIFHPGTEQIIQNETNSNRHIVDYPDYYDTASTTPTDINQY
ncbi:hypothetical protein I4U23_005812 [Adineta vaga]|nr:hypothetical protein I4U23_005812 [Adineta vaga]